jgi:hypothetical protein
MKGTTSLAAIAEAYGKSPEVLTAQVESHTGGERVESVEAISTGTGVDVFEVMYGKGRKLSVFVNPNSGQALVRKEVGKVLAEAA